MKYLPRLIQVYNRIRFHESIISARSLPREGVSRMDLRYVAKRITFSIASCILLLLLYMYIPVVSANLQNETIVYANLVTATSVQGTPTPNPTPTENPTVTAAKNDLVVQQDIAARNQNDPSITIRLWNSVHYTGKRITRTINYLHPTCYLQHLPIIYISHQFSLTFLILLGILDTVLIFIFEVSNGRKAQH